MSMEERLALYKKRYGKGLESEASDPDPKARSSTLPNSEPSREKREGKAQNPDGILGKLQNLFGTGKE
jgi:hypothetical protein